MRNACRVALTPVFVDLEAMAEVPVVELPGRGREAGFLSQLPHTSRPQRFIDHVAAAGDGLPEPRMIGTLQQKHIECRRVDHHEH